MSPLSPSRAVDRAVVASITSASLATVGMIAVDATVTIADPSVAARSWCPESREGAVRLFLNVGHNLGIRPQDIVGAIANEANVPGRTIGSIDIFDGYSFVEVPAEDPQQIIDALSQSGIKGKYVNVEVARPDAGPRGGPRRDRLRPRCRPRSRRLPG